MEITEAQYRLIKQCLPTQQQGNMSLSKSASIECDLARDREGLKMARPLSIRFGNWHMSYTA
jgi:hypothetical protein